MTHLCKTVIRANPAPRVARQRFVSPLLILLAALFGGCSSSDNAPLLGDDASLSLLTISDGTLDPVFSSSVGDYTASVPHDTDNIDVSVTATDSDASITINGGVDTNIPLSVGDNTILVVVTAEDGTTTRTYTIVVSRAALSGNANLQDLKLSVGESIPIDLYPTFDAQVSEYQAVLVSRQSVTVDAIAEDDRATVSWGVTPECGMQLCLGLSQLAVTVIAEDGVTDQTYKVSLMNQAPLGDWWNSVVSLAADGNTLAIGVPGDDSTSTGVNGDQTQDEVLGWRSGAVYVFVRDGAGVWAKQAFIKASNSGYDDQFGNSVALSGDGSTLVVSAQAEDSAATGLNGDEFNDTATSSGAIYIFTRDSNGAWSQDAYVKASNTEAANRFGNIMALSTDGSTLAANIPGGIEVFIRDSNGVWRQDAVVARDTEVYEDFGPTIALSGDGSMLAVRAQLKGPEPPIIEKIGNSEGTDDPGVVLLFAQDAAGTWSEEGSVRASNEETYDFFGYSVALSGDGSMLAVSAPGEDSAATGVNGDEADNSESGSGAAYLFARDSDGSWTQQTYIKASNTDAGDQFGRDIKLSPDGLTLAVLASQEDSPGNGESGDGINDYANDTYGAVYLFGRGDDGSWSQRHYAKPLRQTRPYSVEGGDDLRIYRGLGTLGLSADGLTCIVGTQSNDSSAPELIWNNEDNTHLGAGVVFGYTFQN